MLTRPSRLADPAAASTDAPLRHCADCQLNLGTRPGDTLRAAFACPRFGKPRHGVESRCSAFVAKVAVVAAALSMTACSVAPGLYVESGLSAQDVRYAEIAITGPNSWHFASRSHNPFAEIAVGYRLALSQRLSAEIAVSHESSIATGNDRGVNSASVSVRWFPFSF